MHRGCVKGVHRGMECCYVHRGKNGVVDRCMEGV